MLRVLYVEDDPALRGILTAILDARAGVEIVGSVGNSADALALAETTPIDVALLDLHLGSNDLTGIEVGAAIRRLHPNAGIVLLTQHQVPGFLTRLDDSQRQGWSFILKRADLQPQYLFDVMQSTARGLNVIDPQMIADSTRATVNVLERLTTRQREVMALAAQGMDAPTIAARLDASAGAIRQDLSRAYQVLVPDPPAGADMRTLAVLRYRRETRGYGEENT
jgi:two-component system, NarL family, response regulator DesR